MSDKEWNTFWPDWCDTNKLVELEMKSGALVTGELYISDFFSDGDCGEVPIFSVISDEGVEYSFADHENWRFI